MCKRHKACAKLLTEFSNMAHLVSLLQNPCHNLAKWSLNTIEISKLNTYIHYTFLKVCLQNKFTIKAKFSFSLEMKIERAVGNGSAWNYTMCTGLRQKLNVFLHKHMDMLHWIVLHASANEPSCIHFCQFNQLNLCSGAISLSVVLTVHPTSLLLICL